MTHGLVKRGKWTEHLSMFPIQQSFPLLRLLFNVFPGTAGSRVLFNFCFNTIKPLGHVNLSQESRGMLLPFSGGRAAGFVLAGAVMG